MGSITRMNRCLIKGMNGLGLYRTKAPDIMKNKIDAPALRAYSTGATRPFPTVPPGRMECTVTTHKHAKERIASIQYNLFSSSYAIDSIFF